jgi:hypothetical protein
VRAALEAFLRRFPDGRDEDGSSFGAGDCGFGEWTFVGTSVDGEAVRIRGCDLHEPSDSQAQQRLAQAGNRQAVVTGTRSQDRQRCMEPLWSPVVATGGKRSSNPTTAGTAETSQKRCRGLRPVAEGSAW